MQIEYFTTGRKRDKSVFSCILFTCFLGGANIILNFNWLCFFWKDIAFFTYHIVVFLVPLLLADSSFASSKPKP